MALRCDRYLAEWCPRTYSNGPPIPRRPAMGASTAHSAGTDGASGAAAGRIRIGQTSLVGAAKLREAGEEGLIEPAFARLGLSASPGGSRRRVSALLASVLAHGSVFVAALLLLQQTTPPRPLAEVAVALQFMRSPDAF